ncbi:MAG: response regulator [Flavobacteriales bacterium]
MHVAKAPTPLLVPTVLYMDASEAARSTFLTAFRHEFDVLLAFDLGTAMAHLERTAVHVVICDQCLPGVTGSMVLARVRERYPQIKRMLVTSHADLQGIVDALNQGGACFYIQEPWEVEVVRTAVARAFTEIRQEQERKNLTDRLVAANQQLEFALRQSLLA